MNPLPCPKSIPDQFRERLFEFARQRAAGKEIEEAASALGVSYEMIARHVRRWPAVWQEAMKAAGIIPGFRRNSVVPRDVKQAMADGDIKTLPGFFERMYRPRRLLGHSENTMRLYTICFTHWTRCLGRIPLVVDLTEEGIVAFMEYMLNSPSGALGDRQRSFRTINKCRDQLMALARFAFYKKLLPALPDVLALPEPRKTPIAFTVEEIGQLLATCRALDFPPYIGHGCERLIGEIPVGAYWFAIVHVIYWTGLRAGAAWGLERRHINLDAGTVLALADTQKQKADQLLRIHRDCVQALRAIWLPDRLLMFPWPYDIATRYNQFRAIVQRAGIKCERYSVFHKIRKTTATLCKRYGADPTAQLGHSSDAVTRRHYLDPDGDVQAADVLPSPEAFTKSNGNGAAPTP